ncbi:hypothetical protein M2226_009545 [Bradyrhizobium elkanii]|nr:hypothetical protein [Bradyrhizobium elkanii]MCW2175902.1 hypothetical protein [Bradyrhizobium elkanii]
MDNWDSDFLDLVEEAHLTFGGKSDGEIAFGTLKGFLDMRYGSRDGSACAKFSWEGHDENDPSCGRGWAMIGTAGRLVGKRLADFSRPGEEHSLVCGISGWSRAGGISDSARPAAAQNRSFDIQAGQP